MYADLLFMFIFYASLFDLKAYQLHIKRLQTHSLAGYQISWNLTNVLKKHIVGIVNEYNNYWWTNEYEYNVIKMNIM